MPHSDIPRAFLRRLAIPLTVIVAAVTLSPTAATASRPDSTRDDARSTAVFGSGTVTVDDSDPQMAGHQYTLRIAAASSPEGRATGSMRVRHRDPDTSKFTDIKLRVDCLQVRGNTAVLSAWTVRETNQDGPVPEHIGFRAPVKIVDHGTHDELIFGHGPPAAPDCGSTLFPDDLPLMPVSGDFRFRG